MQQAPDPIQPVAFCGSEAVGELLLPYEVLLMLLLLLLGGVSCVICRALRGFLSNCTQPLFSATLSHSGVVPIVDMGLVCNTATDRTAVVT